MRETSAQQDLEDARRELQEALDQHGHAMAAPLRAKLRQALALLGSVSAKLGYDPKEPTPIEHGRRRRR